MIEEKPKGLLSDGKFDFLFMKQVPIRTKEEFVNLASLEFGGHFGFTLKALMDSTIALQNQLAIERMEALEKEVVVLKQMFAQKENEKPVRKTVAGTEIGGKENGLGKI